MHLSILSETQKQLLPFVKTLRKEYYLAAMKAYALGRRAKWKDYVDLYFILRDFCTLQEVTESL